MKIGFRLLSIARLLFFIFLTYRPVLAFANDTFAVDFTGAGVSFSDSLRGLIKMAKKDNWKLEIHLPLDANLESLPNIKRSMTLSLDSSLETFKNAIGLYEKKITTSEIAAGSSLIIIIDGHGAPNVGNGLQTTHFVQGANLFDSFNLDLLKPLTELAKDYKVNLAILDFSCFSGATLNLANENTCVITASDERHWSTSHFADAFFSQIDRGMSVEDIFLRARKAVSEPVGYPMISTPENKKIVEKIYSQIFPYLYLRHGYEDSLIPYLIGVINHKEPKPTPPDAIVREVEEFMRQERVSGEDLSKFRQALNSYYSEMQDLIRKLSDSKYSNLANFEEFKINLSGEAQLSASFSHEISWYELLISNFDPGWKSSSSSKCAHLQSLDEKHLCAAFADRISSEIDKKAEIQFNSPGLSEDLKTFVQYYRRYDQQSYSQDISLEEQKLFDVVYRHLKGADLSINPCTKIKFDF